MKILKYQHWHFILLSILLIAIYFYVIRNDSLLNGEFLEINTSTWFLIAILSPIFHQVYVLLCWRLELFYNSISNVFGENGFLLFKLGFGILFISRLLTIIVLAFSNTNTLNINSIFAYVMAGILFIPCIYLFYFKYSSNSMYVFGLLILYIPGLLLLSKAAILVALFNHIYIWIHFYFTELPDIKVIYKD